MFPERLPHGFGRFGDELALELVLGQEVGEVWFEDEGGEDLALRDFDLELIVRGLNPYAEDYI